ncbi:peptidylprolyl isomerase [Thermodesulfobacteriota bacterium]
MEDRDKLGTINTSRSHPSEPNHSYLEKDKSFPSVLSMSPGYSKYRDKIIFGSIIILLFIFSGGVYFLINYQSAILEYFGYEKKMRISVILMETKPQAQAIVKVLDNGSDFAKLAKLYSFGPGKEKGGDLGYIAPGYLIEELDMVALNLKVGEYSGVVETKAGYFILMKIDERHF